MLDNQYFVYVQQILMQFVDVTIQNCSVEIWGTVWNWTTSNRSSCHPSNPWHDVRFPLVLVYTALYRMCSVCIVHIRVVWVCAVWPLQTRCTQPCPCFVTWLHRQHNFRLTSPQTNGCQAQCCLGGTRGTPVQKCPTCQQEKKRKRKK